MEGVSAPAKEFAYSGDALKKNWQRLHRGDCEPFPKDPAVQEAWRLFHQGKFAEAVALRLAGGRRGHHRREQGAGDLRQRRGAEGRGASIALFEEVMKHAEAQAKAEPKNANAHYLYAYAAGRYSQRISVAKALAQGYGGRIRAALEAALKLQPKHADAHIAMGAYHAEIIDKVGALVGGLTYGAKREAGEEHYPQGIEAGARFAHRPHRDGERHGDDARQEDESRRPESSMPGPPSIEAARRHGEARRGGRERGARVNCVAQATRQREKSASPE